MPGLRFTKPERELLRDILAHQDSLTKAHSKLRDSILDKLERSEMVKAKQPAGLGWQAAANAMRGVLGSGLALPPRPDIGWMARMSNRIKELGLTADDCTTIARYVKARWKPPISFEVLIRGADRWLTEANALSTVGHSHALVIPAGPMEVDDT